MDKIPVYCLWANWARQANILRIYCTPLPLFSSGSEWCPLDALQHPRLIEVIEVLNIEKLTQAVRLRNAQNIQGHYGIIELTLSPTLVQNELSTVLDSLLALGVRMSLQATADEFQGHPATLLTLITKTINELLVQGRHRATN